MQNQTQPEHTEHRRGRKFFFIGSGIYLSILLTLGGFAGGVFVGKEQAKLSQKGTGAVVDKDAKPAYDSKDVDFQQFWDIWNKVKQSYVGQPVDEKQLFYGSIKGIVSSLNDPYSTFFDPIEAADFNRELSGSFEGIGAEIGFRDSKLSVVAPLPDTPASRAGVQAGDYILKIDGTDTTDMALDAAVSKIRGAKGTSVTLTLYRDGWKEPQDKTIQRDNIIVKSVSWKMVSAAGKEVPSGGIGVIAISQFSEDTVSEFDQASRELMNKGAKAIVLDLRNDPGGYLDAAVEVAGGWIDHDTVVIERAYDGTETKYTPKRKQVFKSIPTVVLVNKGSASASEIVAGALQDYGVATIMGETTFGKGSVQNFDNGLADGSALKLTVALWYTPKNRSINKQGIKPDVESALSDKDAEAGNDTQFAQALSFLKDKAGLK